MVTIYNVENLGDILIEMGEYLQENQNQGYEIEFSGYIFDLLTNTGLFHDACGKVIEKDNDKVVVSTDY